MNDDADGGKRIAIIDSGAGGLPYLDRCRAVAPGYSYLYIADNLHFPYGVRDNESLIDIVSSLVERLLRARAPEMCVIACNTASVVALRSLRERFDIPFVGVVPALKPAATHSTSRRIGLLATHRTVIDSYTNDLIRTFASNCHIERVAEQTLVDFVEFRLLDSADEERTQMVHRALESLLTTGIDTIVLGCTHFVYLEQELKRLFGPGVAIVDSRDGVARQTARVALELETGSAGARHGDVRAAKGDVRAANEDVRATKGDARVTNGTGALVTTGREEGDPRYERFADRFGLVYEGIL